MLTANLMTGQALTLCYSILGTRYFLPHEYGTISTGIALVMIVSTLSDFGFSQELLRKQLLDLNFNFAFNQNRFFRFLLLSSLATVCLAVVDYQPFILVLPLIGLTWYISILAAIPFRADSNFKQLTWGSSLGRIFGFILAVTILEINRSGLIYVLGFASLYLFDGLFLYIIGRKKYGFEKDYILIPKVENSLVSVLTIIQNFDIVAIRLASPGAAGLFSAVNKWPASLGSLVTALNVVSYKTHLKPENYKNHWQWDFSIFYILTFILSTIAYFFASDLVEILLPDNYSESVKYFRILILVTLVSFWNQVYFSRFIAAGYHTNLIAIYTAWTILQLSLLYFLTKYFNLEAALWSLFFVQILMLFNFIYSDLELRK